MLDTESFVDSAGRRLAVRAFGGVGSSGVGAAAGGGTFAFTVNVHGVTDPGLGAAVGREVARGAADELRARGARFDAIVTG
jgi:hypothetical protein